MDPDEALKNARAALAAYREAQNAPPNVLAVARSARVMLEAMAELADAFEALDGWLSKKGFPPHAWDRSLDETV